MKRKPQMNALYTQWICGTDLPSLPLKLSGPLIDLLGKGWSLEVSRQKTTDGLCIFATKQILIAEHIFASEEKRKNGYFVYLIAHETAHALDKEEGTFNSKAIHGASFMSCLKRICPSELIFYEVSYKPREASRAGISGISLDDDGIDQFI